MPVSVEISAAKISEAHANALNDLLSERCEAGHWIGELSASALSTATAISALSLVAEVRPDWLDTETFAEIDELIDAGIYWLLTQQNDDGGFGDTELSHSNIATSMLVVAAFELAGVTSKYDEVLGRCLDYIMLQGGINGLKRRYGVDKTFAVPILANCAIAGGEAGLDCGAEKDCVTWKSVAALPFEVAAVPQSMYRLMRMPVVSYAIPALVAIGQAKFASDPPWNPFTRAVRSASINRTLAVLQRMQPESGGFLEAIPLTSFVVMGLASSNHENHEIVRNGVRFLLDSFRQKGGERASGSWPIDVDLATWNTTLAINAIGRCPDQIGVGAIGELLSEGHLLPWLLACQNREPHPFTGAQPGGWGWSDLSGAVPDADDTPGALLALRSIGDCEEIESADRARINEAVQSGIDWLLQLQNRDGGWPTFCRGWGKLPFDRSGSDITAHVLRALNAWREVITQPTNKSARQFKSRIRKAKERGVDYLKKQQRSDGSWIPLWFGNQDDLNEENPFYGTAKVLLAFRDLELGQTPAAQRGLKWLRENQNFDGGWGGNRSITRPPTRFSSVEETSLVVETLATMTESLTPDDDCVNNGANWLIDAVSENGHRQVSPIGFYFARLWYHERLYPLIFCVSALGVLKSRWSDCQK